MSKCEACGRAETSSAAPCPRCPSAEIPAASEPVLESTSDALAFMDEFLAELPAGPVTPSPEALQQGQGGSRNFERWYSALDESPIFAAENASKAAAAKPAPSDETGAFVDPATPSAAEGGEIERLLAADEVPAGGDGRRVAIDAAFELSSLPGDDEPLVNVLVTLAADGRPLLDPKDGPIAHVVLALDVSASMNRTDKYPLLTEALSGMLYDLKRPGVPDVLLSIVVFAYGAETIFRDRPASSLDPREVLREIDRSKLRFGRYTDFVGALGRSGKIAYDQVRRNRAMPVRICVLTDGRPQDMPGAHRAMGRIRRLPVDVEALAFGKDADVAALQELVNGGRGGTVKQIRSDTIADAFGHIAESAAQVISNRAVLELELRPGIAGGRAYRYRPARHRFADPAFGDDRTFRTDLGTLESGRRYSLLFQVRLPRTAASETEVGRVTVRLPGHGGPLVFESMLAVARHRGDLGLQPDRDVEAASEVLGALGASSPEEQLRALRARREIYVAERRDPRLLAAIDHAISELESHGNLSGLSAAEQSAILSHTATVGRVA